MWGVVPIEHHMEVNIVCKTNIGLGLGHIIIHGSGSYPQTIPGAFKMACRPQYKITTISRNL